MWVVPEVSGSGPPAQAVNVSPAAMTIASEVIPKRGEDTTPPFRGRRPVRTPTAALKAERVASRA
ncbi:MAG: hypothetical protein AMXMBFR53_30280 [Gemmatimonadota bacterium]